MTAGKKPDPDKKDESWQESRLPGERSGEGVDDLFNFVLRDIRRKAGLPPKQETPGEAGEKATGEKPDDVPDPKP